MNKKVAILGCGPSGLLAAHTARKLGQDVTVISPKERSPILGGQYLHEEIPGITGKPDHVTYIKIGDTQGYSQKVYGKPDVPCFRFPAGEYPAWSMTYAYDILWGIWKEMIQNRFVEPDEIADLCEEYSVVLSTVPRNAICYREEHKFDRQMIRVVQNGTLISPGIENVVLYSGRPQDIWYRTSNLFGHHTTEWSEASTSGIDALDLFKIFNLPVDEDEAHMEVALMGGFKPLRTDCDCHSEHDNFFRIGRFGEWRHGILVSDAVDHTKDAIALVNGWDR